VTSTSGMKTSSSALAKGLKRLMITVPIPNAGMVTGYLITSGLRASPSLNCTGPKAMGATARLKST
jgi:hypothetical protein